MDDNKSSIRMLTMVDFGLRTRNVIVELCCETLNDLANLLPKYLDRSIFNLHKSFLNVDNLTYGVQFNATKWSILYTIQMNFLDQINCNAELEPADGTTLNAEDLNLMHQDFLEHTQLLTLTEGLRTITIPKLVLSDWTNFKSAVIEECLGKSIGHMAIPLCT